MSVPTRTQTALAIAVIALGCMLLVAAFWLPPAAEIHSSVLVAFGEILTFAGTLLGIDIHYRSTSLKK